MRAGPYRGKNENLFIYSILMVADLDRVTDGLVRNLQHAKRRFRRNPFCTTILRGIKRLDVGASTTLGAGIHGPSVNYFVNRVPPSDVRIEVIIKSVQGRSNLAVNMYIVIASNSFSARFFAVNYNRS